MADVARVATASGDTTHLQKVPQISGDLYAGEVLAAVAPCYIKASDGKVYQCNGTAANEAAKFDGFTARAVDINQPVTLYGIGARFQYGSGMTIGADLYLSATAGVLADAPTAGGLVPIARVITATDIRVTRNSETLGVTGTAVAGVAAGYKIARGQGTTVAASDTIATGLTTVVSAVANLEDAPVIGADRVNAAIGDQAGAPVAGSILIKSFKPTAAGDATPIAATTFGKKYNWVAVGT